MEYACYTDWKSLPDTANALFSRAAQDSVFLSRPWFENLVEHALEEGQSLFLACVVEEGNVLAILPLMQCEGEHWHSLGHLYTSLYSVLLAEDAPREVLSCLVEGLNRTSVHSLRLHPLADDDTPMHDLQRALEESGFSCHRYFRFYNWIHRLQGESYEDYMAARPARVRNTVARKQRKLEREHDCTVHIYSRSDVEQGMADYNSVYAASWKVNELFANTVAGMASRFSETGWLRLGVLYIEDQPAAAQFWFVAHGKASIFKLAYDETWKHYSPGSILTRHLMEYVIDVDKVDEIDFLTGNDAYKRDWMSERRERCGLRCVNMNPGASRLTRLPGFFRQWFKGAVIKNLRAPLSIRG